ncbi:hypothetical protein F991_03060 [Acinetobacter sp. CIP-A165]|uniref:hypothetical protein n=1 Tax=Acinetobacter sp. CIP-A165 TaxID=40373 RepID=UPI0002CDF95F|nr:hypothetical protein [Acinetobacter sp. CIP-A165]ENU28936.1 hypothetical protein F991_03060 [Acinetobacter sp. CIP-A165]
MRLKYLTLCLLGLSLSACSQHVIKTNTSTAGLEQKAINSINAMYEYPSYDYRGKFNVHVELDQNKAATRPQAPLDAALKQKVEQYLRDQKVNLNSKQKQALYDALAQDKSSYGQTKVDKVIQSMAMILNDMQFEYDGSVHYRQKMGSFNLTARYEKPTLLVQAKVPMVLDLNDHKFYVNYFGFMPYLVNKENQNNLAYFDFSKYQGLIKQVDYKKFVEYLKASSGVFYRLADQQNIQALPVSSAERAAGVVEKIRLKTTIEEAFLQSSLYSKVNEKYLMQSILNMNEQSLEKLIADEVDAQSKSKKASSTKNTKTSSDDASVVSQQLYQLVNQHFGVEDEADAYDSASEDASAAALEAMAAAEATQAVAWENKYDTSDATAEENLEAVMAAAESGYGSESDVEAAYESGLSREQCDSLSSNPKITYGDAQYCQSMHGVDVFNPTQSSASGLISYIAKLSALEELFSVYNQAQFIDDHAFKALWIKHQTEINQALPVDKRNPFLIDISLDEKGRAINYDYDLNYTSPELRSRVNLKADMQVLNYGKATPIDRAQLKRAKTWSEVSKGSMFEQSIDRFTEKMGQAGIVERAAQPYTLSLDDQLKVIAAQRYDATRSYEQTYKAVFIAKLTESTPQVVQRYSTKELQEIASVYAYWYSSEEVYNPQGAALTTIEALQKKHHLEDDEQFNYPLGESVDRIVSDAMRGDKDRQAWKKLQAQYKQPQQLFAKQYQVQFERENGASSEEKILLEQTANILGQVYVAARHNKLTLKTIQNLKVDHDEFIDYEIFKDVYQKMLTVK